jgi:membrane-associated protease RseP (regulator of RpoE activity)
MNKCKWSWDVLLIASVVFTAGFCAQPIQIAGAVDSVEPEGRIVEIAPAVGEPARIEEPVIVEDQAEQSEPPTFWIGIRGRNVTEPVLRTQFQLAADLGVVIEEVVKESPAAKAGLRQHDILLRANGEPVLSMEELSRMVASGDAKPIELLLIRLGKEETIVVVPEERPEGMARSSNRDFGGGFGFDNGDPLGALRMFRGGIGVLPQGGAMAFNNSAPNGYSVNITRENGQPAKITVKKGDKTWTIEGDNKEALAELPDDVRAHVEGLLNGNLNMGGNLDLFRNQMPDFQLRGWPGGNFNDQQDQIFKRMEEMERQLKQLQKQLEQE